MKTLGTRLSTNRYMLRVVYYPWILLPYPVRRLVASAGIWGLQLLRRTRGTHRRQELTPPDKMFALSFWGVPDVDTTDYVLTVDGNVRTPLRLSLEELKGLDTVERPVTLDCVGGSRNNAVMRGVPFEYLLARAEAEADTRTAVFYCADGFHTTHPVEDLVQTEAFLAYAASGLEEPEHGSPLRLVAPRKYGYKWAKWVVRIELTSGSPKGYWERRGLPDRAWVGDIR